MKFIWRFVTFVLCVLMTVETSEFILNVPVLICDPRNFVRWRQGIQHLCEQIAVTKPEISNGNFVLKLDDGIERPTDDMMHAFMHFGRRR